MKNFNQYPKHIQAFILEQQKYEGWCPPGGTLNGVKYPKGTLSYQNNNPCNLHYKPWMAQTLGAKKGIDGFARFKNEDAGLAAGCEFLTLIIQNEIKPYRESALAQGLTNAGQLTIGQYFHIYAPATDRNNPAKYAAFVAVAAGALVQTRLEELAKVEAT